MVASALIEVLILETDAGEIPAIGQPVARPYQQPVLAWLAEPSACGIGGLPNLIDSARAAA